MGYSSVKIFYSSRTDPGVIEHYRDGILYLQNTDIDLEIIDVGKNPEKASKHGVSAPPAVVIEENGERHTHQGVLAGLEELLKRDTYGKSVLHKLGFRDGREATENLDVTRDSGKDEVEKALNQAVEPRGLELDIRSFDPGRKKATVTVESAGEDFMSPGPRAFIGGLFTELFDTGVKAEEVWREDGVATYRVMDATKTGDLKDRLKEVVESIDSN